jgi:hypothetical protein
MEETNSVKKIEIASQSNAIGNPAPALTFIFAMLTMEFWGIYAGIFAENTNLFLAVGLVQIACFAPYLIGAILFFLKGDSVNGNAFLIFATVFGGVGGFCNTAIGISTIFGFGINEQMAAIPFVFCGISVLPVVWLIKGGADKVTFICFVAAAIFLTLVGLNGLTVLTGDLVMEIIKWLSLLVGVTGFYSCLNGLLTCGGSKGLPVGKPFFK